ncbi:hypothetical protein E2C01_005139 [Portunus trituberculatus]|uniref:Uncharacterized protein n=1 Tax=Portunus trituberculatus TaxID=210409 RepID=A0A5B7CRT9_PORTR|nr:hypothetical protein [Portunus trituberculatus]
MTNTETTTPDQHGMREVRQYLADPTMEAGKSATWVLICLHPILALVPHELRGTSAHPLPLHHHTCATVPAGGGAAGASGDRLHATPPRIPLLADAENRSNEDPEEHKKPENIKPRTLTSFVARSVLTQSAGPAWVTLAVWHATPDGTLALQYRHHHLLENMWHEGQLDKASQEAEKEGDKEEEPVCGLDIKTLTECLGGIEKALETLKERDPNPAKSSKVAHDPVRQAILSHLPILLQLALPQYPFFKPLKHADPATVDPSISASDSADDDVFSLSAHSAENE